MQGDCVSPREPFGIVIPEAMALGKPVVAGADGGPREIVTHGVDGLLARFDDSDALARAVLRYLGDRQFGSPAPSVRRRARTSGAIRRRAVRERCRAGGCELVPC